MCVSICLAFQARGNPRSHAGCIRVVSISEAEADAGKITGVFAGGMPG